MSSSDSDVEISTGPLTLKDVYHFAVKQKRRPTSRSQSLNFIPSAILPVRGSTEGTSGSSRNEVKESYSAGKEYGHSSTNKSNSNNATYEIEGSEESIARSSMSDVYEMYTAEEGSNNSSPNTSNGCRAAHEFKAGRKAVEDDLIRFSSFLDTVPSTSRKQVLRDVEEDSTESTSVDMHLRTNSPAYVKVEKNDTEYFTCNESLQSKVVMDESAIIISDEDDDEENGNHEISNESVQSESIVILSDDDQEVVDDSQQDSHTSFEANVEKEYCDPLDSTFERIEKLLSQEYIPENCQVDATTEGEIESVRAQKEEYLTPQKVPSSTAKNLLRAHFKSGIPISTSKTVPKQPMNDKDLFKTPITPISKRKPKMLNAVSPVAMYIKYSPQPFPLRKVTASTKPQNPIKKSTFTYKDELPKVFYKPSTLQVSHSEEKMKLPPSYCKLLLNPLVYKHEQRMGPVMEPAVISAVLAELERNPYSKLDESNINVSFWTVKGAYEEAQAS